MNKATFIRGFALLLVIAFVAPLAFFSAPQRTSASALGCMGGAAAGLLGIGGNAISTALSVPVNSFVSNVFTGGTNVATLDSCITDTILIPLARAVIRQMLQQLTASVITWINGGNGTGQPSFVMNLGVHLQSVGDSAALSLITGAATAFNSPFGSAISASLRLNYLQQTSMAGFFAANQSTLSLVSPNINSFLAGNWSQGGTAAWLALTTQPQNNPYALYQSAMSQLGSNVAQAQQNRRQDLLQSNGFLSWCGGNTTSTSGSCVAVNGSCPAGCVPDGYAPTGCSGSSISPQAPCTNPDGTPANAITPGSIIHDFTQQAVVNSGFQQLIASNDLDNALGAIVNALLKNVLGGTGLFGASQPPSGGGRSITSQLNNYKPDNTAVGSSATAIAQAALDRIAAYNSAWSTIGAAANTASSSVQALITFCNAAAADTANASNQTFIAAATAQVTEAQTALTTYINPVIVQAQAAPGLSSTTQAFALKVSLEAATASSTLGTDVQTLTGMPPTAADLASAQQDATASGGAQTNPDGSLVLVANGASTVSRMNLLSTNAVNLETKVCTPSASASTSFGG